MALLTFMILLYFLNQTFGNDACVPINEEPDYINMELGILLDMKLRTSIHRPPCENTTVHFRFLMKHFNFDSVYDVLTVQNMAFATWKVDELKWNPQDHHGIEELETTHLYMWTPSFQLSNEEDFYEFDAHKVLRCTLKSDGFTTCVFWLTHRAWCNVKLTNWPYDVQECSLEFGKLDTTEQYAMDFGGRAIVTEDAKDGPEWYISNHKQEVTHIAGKELKLTFTLVREAAGLAAIIIYPAFTITALSIIPLFLDVRSNVRLGVFCFSIFSHYYFLTELAYNIPRESAYPPTVLFYYRGSVILTITNILLTVFLSSMCKFRSTPHKYVKSINDFVFDGYKMYFVFPQWCVDSTVVDKNRFVEDWTKFANTINSVFIFITLCAYIGLYGSFIPNKVM